MPFHACPALTVSDQAQYRSLYPEAQFHAIEGRPEVALANLRTWLDRKFDIFTYIKRDPLMENLREEQEFHSIVAEVEAQLAEIRVQYHGRQANAGGG